MGSSPSSYDRTSGMGTSCICLNSRAFPPSERDQLLLEGVKMADNVFPAKKRGRTWSVFDLLVLAVAVGGIGLTGISALGSGDMIGVEGVADCVNEICRGAGPAR